MLQANSTLYQCSKEEDESYCSEESTNFPEVFIERVEDPDFGIEIGEWETSMESNIPTKISLVAIKIDELDQDSYMGVFYGSNLGNDSFQLEAMGSSLFSLDHTPQKLALNDFGRKYHHESNY